MKYDRLERLSIGLSRPTALIGILGLMLIALITVASVVARAVFNYPLIWAHDASSLLIIIIVATCFPTGVMLRKHVAIEFLGGALGSRAHRWLTAFGALVTSAALAVLAWQMTVIAGQETAGHASTVVARIPTGPLWWLAAVIVWVSVPMQGLVTLLIITGKVAPVADGDHV